MPSLNKHISACTELSGTDGILKRISVLIYALILVLDITSEENDLPIFQKELKLAKFIQGIFSTFRQGRPLPQLYLYLLGSKHVFKGAYILVNKFKRTA